MVKELVLLEAEAAKKIKNSNLVIYLGGDTPEQVFDLLFSEYSMVITTKNLYQYRKYCIDSLIFYALVGVHPSHHLVTGRNLTDVKRFEKDMNQLKALSLFAQKEEDKEFEQYVADIDKEMVLDRAAVIESLNLNNVDIDELKKFRKSLYYINVNSIENAISIVQKGLLEKNSMFVVALVSCHIFPTLMI